MRQEKKRSLRRELQVRFVLLATLAAAVLLSVVVGVALLRSYGQIVKKADHLLEVLWGDNDSPELGDARYFTVDFSPAEHRVSADLTHTELLREKSAVDMGRQVLKAEKTQGFLEDYRYAVLRQNDGIHILFLSRKLPLEAFRDTKRVLLGTSVLGLLAAAAVLSLLSGRVVAPLMEASEKQKEFITSASHALKTPVAVILGDAQLLQMEYGGNEWLLDIEKQAKCLAEMTKALVTLSRCEEGTRQGSFLEFPISDVAQDVADSFQSMAANRALGFEVNVFPNLGYCGDEKALREMMTILLDNAFRYCPNGGNVTFTLEKKHRGLSLIVENTAENIRQEELSHFTDRFYRGSTSGSTPGSGLGLAIAQSIAQRHRGRLTVSTPDGQKIRICVTL